MVGQGRGHQQVRPPPQDGAGVGEPPQRQQETNEGKEANAPPLILGLHKQEGLRKGI